MSPLKIPDEKREMHWQMLCAIVSNPAYYWTHIGGEVSPRTDLCAEAWELIEQHKNFLSAKERAENFIPVDVDDEEDGA